MCDFSSIYNRWSLVVSALSHCIWKSHPSGAFTIDSAWELIHDIRPSNTMYNLLQFKGHIPCHSFIFQHAYLGHLRTMDRLYMTRIIRNTTYILFGHLFFHRHYSSLVWGTINNKANMQWPASYWHHLFLQASTIYQKKKNITHMIAPLLLSNMVYFIWQERNNRIFSNHYQPPQTTGEEIYQLIRTHITNMEHKCTIPTLIRDAWSLLDPQSNALMVAFLFQFSSLQFFFLFSFQNWLVSFGMLHIPVSQLILTLSFLFPFCTVPVRVISIGFSSCFWFSERYASHSLCKFFLLQYN